MIGATCPRVSHCFQQPLASGGQKVVRVFICFCVYVCTCVYCTCMHCMWLHVLTCPKPIGCCCWGWNAGFIVCGLLRRGLVWWCCRPGMPRPLYWHEDSKTEVGGEEERHGVMKVMCKQFSSQRYYPHYKLQEQRRFSYTIWKRQHLWQEDLWACQWFQLCLIKPLNIVATVLWIWSRWL